MLTINDFEIGTAQVPFATFSLGAHRVGGEKERAAAPRNLGIVESASERHRSGSKRKPSRTLEKIIVAGTKKYRKTTSEMLLIDFIDPISSFEVSFRIPNERRYDDVQIGDACELIVSSDDDLFRNFVAIREAYVPELDVWVGEYPFLDRNGFVLVSKRVSNN